VYFEAGDHTALVHLSPEQFLSLMQGVVRTHFIRAH
jgi:prolyl-tRNA editing enzyme YbaK/EbsC (Cys-tRNA(Pro) deacylase)